MKHLVWLMLLAFGTALAQVQPVVMPLAQDVVCCCCEDGAGGCEMDPGTGRADCYACVTCIPAQVFVPAGDLVAPDTCFAELSRLDWMSETANALAYPPPLPPPRLMA